MEKPVSIEVEGNTIKEAVNKALQRLKVPRNRVKIEVLSEEKRGLFGMGGARLAKIRVTMLSPAKKKISDK